jgi:RNA polymerase subunit RPABC4/transcription elongation factor Spt4
MANRSDDGAKDSVACPHCGELIARKAKFCRHCGSDENTGWSASNDHAIDWPDESDYADAVAEEFGNDDKPAWKGRDSQAARPPAAPGYAAWVKVAAIVLALLFVWQILKALG